MGPHTDTGGLKDVRLVFSFGASAEGVTFNPPTLHAGRDLATCCSTVIGRVHNGTVTLQVGGIGHHAVGPLSPNNLRLTLLYNVELEDDFDFALLPALTRLHSWPALQVPPQLHDAMVGLAANLVPNPIGGSVMSRISTKAQKRGSGNQADAGAADN